MRNPKRLDSFYDHFKDIHATYFPDWRFGQLISNFFGWLLDQGHDPWFPEEGEMLRLFRQYATGEKDEDNTKG